MHRKPRWWSRLRPRNRKSKIVAGFASFALVMGIGAAVALYIGHAQITGGISTSPFAPVWEGADASGPQVVNDGAIRCAIDAEDGVLNLNVTGALPGDSCTVSGYVHLNADAGQDGTVTGVDLTLPTGWTATLTTGCGTDVGSSQLTDDHVGFTLAMDPTATPGGHVSFGASDGVAIAPASEGAPLSCTP